jgi:hypothetical protein
MNKSYPFSNISISGMLSIRTHYPQNGFVLCHNDQKDVHLGVFSKPMKSGVYEIVNLQNPEKTYIGKSNNLDARMKAHFYKLEHHTAISKSMQVDYDFFIGYTGHNKVLPFDGGLKLASDLFEFRIILYARPSELTFYENILINAIKPYYNQKKIKE